ncbi:penicillin-binding transpeptidase domain-containing protein, partial [Alphaproteobacteria bacterium]|nr:penicillin-binding transpeptidase domain-containing protein [Alphaproteobacteria bacterium]
MTLNVQRASQRRSAIKLAGDKSTALGLARGRLVVIKAFFVLVFLLVGVRASDLSVLQKKEYQGDSYRLEEGVASNIGAEVRGPIRDRNGSVLATTLKTASLYADPHLVSDPVAASKKLTKIFPSLSYGKLLKDLQSKKRFVWIKRSIMPAEQHAVLEIGEPGLQFESEYARFYPQGELFSHVLGYTNVDGAGIAGIENSFDGLLSGGGDLQLSLDARFQHLLRREIIGASKKFSAIGGSGVIMDVKSGEVAGVSWPDFDLNNQPAATNNQKFNRLTVGTYELGSVFKVFSTAAFLENYDVPMSTKFDASKPIKRGRFTIRDYHAEARELTIPEIFMHSSNIGSALMGEAVGTEKLRSFYEDLGLMGALDVEIPEKGAPQIPSPWRDINTLTASYGHGIAVTPLHVASSVSTVVNGG